MTRKTIAVLVMIVSSAAAQAATLEPVGVIGNSGFAGASLLKMHPGGFPGGAVLDEEMTLWRTAAPDRLERVALDGRLIAAYKIEGGRMGHNAHNVRVALVGDYVVALFVDMGRMYVMRRDLDPADPRNLNGTRTMKPLELDPPIRFWYASGLGARGIAGRAIVDDRTAVQAIDPATGKTEKLFDLPGNVAEHGLETTAGGIIYVSGDKTWAFDVRGNLLREGPKLWGRLNAVPGGLLAFNYGSVQHTTESLASPRKLFWNANIEITRLGQATAITPTTYAFASMGGPIYLGDYAGDRITLNRRYGALTPDTIGLSAQGEVLAACYGGFLVWQWDDPADAVPFYSGRQANILRCGQMASRGKFTWGIKQSYRTTEKMQVWIWPPGPFGLEHCTLEGERPARPRGMTVTEDWKMFLSAENDRNLYVAAARREGYINANVRKVTWDDTSPLRAPGDLAGWRDGKVLVADGNEIVMLHPAGEHYRQAWRFSSWGEKPEERFGDEVHVAVTGDYLLVADTQRHRVLVFDLPDRKPAACLGSTDRPGAGILAFDHPTQLAANGLLVGIYDRGNQRVVKCELKPEEARRADSGHGGRAPLRPTR